MTLDNFWSIIDQSRQDKRSPRSQGDALQKLLKRLPANEIIDFSKYFEEVMEQSYTQIVLAAATIIYVGLSTSNRGPSDDSFDDFRAWLIGQGRAVFTMVTEDPDSLAELLDHPVSLDFFNGEPLLLADDSAFQEVVGNARVQNRVVDHLDYNVRFGRPEGEPWHRGDLPRLLPKLSAMFNPDAE